MSLIKTFRGKSGAENSEFLSYPILGNNLINRYDMPVHMIDHDGREIQQNTEVYGMVIVKRCWWNGMAKFALMMPVL